MNASMDRSNHYQIDLLAGTAEQMEFYRAAPHPERQDERHIAGPLDQMVRGKVVIASVKWRSVTAPYEIIYGVILVRLLKIAEAYPESNRGYAEYEMVRCRCGHFFRTAHNVGGVWVCDRCFRKGNPEC